jgi:hypothetical protein
VALYTDSLSLNDVLNDAGAIMVDKREDAEIDLTPESVERDTILKLLY